MSSSQLTTPIVGTLILPAQPTERPMHEGWKYEICSRSDDDEQTCSRGVWFPCCLYGRLDTSIKLAQEEKRADLTGMGCNPACLLWQVTFCGFGGVLTAIKRTSVRGLYDINGSLKDDCLKSFFCNCCVLVQSEREIYARTKPARQRAEYEGLARTHPEIIGFQPMLSQVMTYAPGEGAQARSEVENMILCRTLPQAHLHDDPRYRHKPCATGRHHQLQEVINASGIEHAIEVVVQCPEPAGTKSQNMSQKSVTVTAAPLVQRNAVGMLFREPDTSTTATSENLQPTGKPRAKSTGVLSFITNTVPSIFKAKNNSENSITDQPQYAQSQDRGVESCFPGSDYAVPTGHTLKNCATINHDSNQPLENHVSEHSLTDCDTIILSGQRPSKAKRTTYAHDFTECQVDAEILEYFERQEESIRHKLADGQLVAASTSVSSGALAPKSLRTTNSSEHCSDCAAHTTTVVSPRVSKLAPVKILTTQNLPVQSHAARPFKGNDTASKSREQVENADSKVIVHVAELESSEEAVCTTEDCGKDNIISLHTLDTCYRKNSGSLAHPNSTSRNAYGQKSQSFLEKCDLCVESNVIKTHRLSECSRSSSLNALSKSDAQQHRLSQGPRSCSLPVIPPGPKSQHEIEDCTHDESPDEQEVTSSPSLEAYMISSTESPTTQLEASIILPKRRQSKGKSRANDDCSQPTPKRMKNGRNKRKPNKSKERSIISAEHKEKDLESRNLPQHAELVSEMETNTTTSASHPDITVEVDVVVAGKRVKAETIPVFDGPTSARPSQIRNASAQQALANVFVSQKTLSVKPRTSQKSLSAHPYQRQPQGCPTVQSENSREDDVVVLGTPGPESMAALAADKVGKTQSELSAGQRLFAVVSGFVGRSSDGGMAKE